MTLDILKFTPFQSSVDASFWQTLVSKKLDEIKLSKEPIPIQGYYNFNIHNISTLFNVPDNGFDVENKVKLGFGLKGSLVNTNTIEEFKSMDKNELFQRLIKKINLDIDNNLIWNNTNLLNPFLLLSFADLKKYKFYYWFAFPAFIPKSVVWSTDISQIKSISNDFTPSQSDYLLNHYLTVIDSNNSFFFIKKDGNNLILKNSSQFESIILPEIENWILGFIDPSNSKDGLGWTIRNMLYFLQKKYNIKSIKILSWRGNIENSILLNAELSVDKVDYSTVGWERNIQGKLGPRLADLGSLMDPIRLADTSIDLNLKLMKWRVMPDLDLEKIKNTKCLLLGAGTLGCYVARCLIGWGVRNITFVDNGKVSFSNPVRQPLFEFQNALEGLPKAETAANNLKLVQPTLNVKGYDLSIPMPGHPSTSDEKLIKEIELLENLIKEHDVIYLLTDSRESRWYPTVVGTLYHKIIINSALGFDTYLVMRHGSRQQQTEETQLGCYYCNDIVAPTDSLTDRTLDQQCTVTRPGLAAIAGALSVELMVSLLQHPNGINAKADVTNEKNPGSILGLVPHQIRGFLGQFNNLLIVGQAYDKCTACSNKVIEAYQKDKLNFMKNVLKDPIYLEELTGLLELKKQSDELLYDFDIEDEEDF